MKAEMQDHTLPMNPNVAVLPPYNAGMTVARARELSGLQEFARLASNENPDGCSPAVLAALASGDFHPWRYADPGCTALRDRLADHLGVDITRIVAGNGSEEMIAAICRAILRPGDAVLTVVPSFGLHEIEPLAAGARVTKLPMTPDAGFDMAALETALKTGPRLVFLSSPWNPVGPALDHTNLHRLIAATGPQTLLVLDEAYIEYADPGSPDGLQELHNSGIHFVVLRTFSKAYGLAGLRVGYAVCSDAEIARVVWSAKTAFNVNGAAQIAAIAALDDAAWMRASVARTRAERLRVEAGLRALGFDPAPSQTNFVFFDCGSDSTEAAARLIRAGVIIKPWREAGYTRFLRVTIGTPADNDRFLAAMAGMAG